MTTLVVSKSVKGVFLPAVRTTLGPFVFDESANLTDGVSKGNQYGWILI